MLRIPTTFRWCVILLYKIWGLQHRTCGLQFTPEIKRREGAPPPLYGYGRVGDLIERTYDVFLSFNGIYFASYC